MKRVFFFLFPLVLLLFSLTVSAEDITVTELDPFTGVPVEAEDSIFSVSTENRAVLGTDRYYDYDMHMFAYDLGTVSDTPIYASAAYGMVVTDSVKIMVPSGVNALLYRDGVVVEEPDLLHVSDIGSYVLSVSGNSTETREPIRFTIVNRVTGVLDRYHLPEGFLLTAVKREAMPIEGSPVEVDFTEEGFYEIEYLCTPTGITYYLKVNIDHTPPALALTAVKDNAAHGPVDLSDLEDNAKISITLDGTPIRYSNTLTQSGVYHITVTDEAGNLTEYDFTIMLYFNMTGYLFFILVIAAVGVLIGYLIMTRKKLRVR